MANPQISGMRRFAPASKLIEATGEALLKIKEDDNLTWAEVGEALGVEDDQAARYGKGNSEMGFVKFLRGCRAWNGRFSVAAALAGLSIAPGDPALRRPDVQRGMLSLTLVIADLQRAMLDGELTDDELEAMDGLIDHADQFLDALKQRQAEIKADRALNRTP